MTGAQAADLPVKKAVAVDYVRVCSTYGTGYFFIPGTDTCMRISGFVQADYLYLEQESGREDFDDLGFRARIRLNMDFRQPTEYGLLRAFARMDFRRQSGTFISEGEGGPGGLGDSFGRADQAYIQFGGLTAGRSQSFFDFYTYDDVMTTQLTASDVKTQLLAYTFSFGGGFSGTISLEDNTERRAFAGPLSTAGGFVGAPVGFFGTATTAGVVNTFAPAGQEWPDVVANLRLDQAWGSAQLSGSLHDLTATNRAAFGPLGSTALRDADDEIGYAIQAGVMFKLPFIAPGDELWLQATYADGAIGYAGASSGANRFTAIRATQTDAFIDQFGNTQTAEVFSVAGKFKHYWASNLRSNFFGGYQTIEYDGSARTFLASSTAGQPGVFVGFVDTRIWEAGANLIWTPVKNLDIGVEAVYRNFETKGRTAGGFGGGTFNNAGTFTAVSGRGGDSEDVIEARLRIQRDF